MRLIACTVAVGIIATWTHAEAAAFYQGEYEFFSRRGDCPDRNPVGDSGILIFRMTTNSTGLSFFDRARVVNYFLANDSLDATFKEVQVVTMQYDFSPATQGVFVKLNLQAPPVISNDPPEIRLIGEILGYESQPECTALFRAVLARWMP